jgi:hypothetical protein
MRRITAILFAVLASFPAPSRAQNQSYNPRDFTTGDFNGCPDSGNRSDRYANLLKNRELPPVTFERYSLDKVFQDLPDGLPTGRTPRVNWSEADRDEATKYEKLGVVLTGFLVKATQSGEEACNCDSSDNLDFHLSLTETPEQTVEDAMVVEVTPRVLRHHAKWSIRSLRELARQKAKVRVSGWMMWDKEHKGHLGKYRTTLWEIHPILKLEVRQGRRWVNLDNMP